MAETTPENCPFSLGDLHPHLIQGSLGPPESSPKRHLDRFTRFCMGPKCYAVQCTVIGKTSKIAPTHRDFVTLPEEDQATAIGNIRKTFGKDCTRGSGDMLVDRQTDTHTDVLITILCHRSQGRSINVYCKYLIENLCFARVDMTQYTDDWCSKVVQRLLSFSVFFPRLRRNNNIAHIIQHIHGLPKKTLITFANISTIPLNFNGNLAHVLEFKATAKRSVSPIIFVISRHNIVTILAKTFI